MAEHIKAFLPRPCDACAVGPAVVFCRPHAAFFCATCDCASSGDIRHERVWMCEVCEQAPAAVTCKADAASLCDTCDKDIHSANPLAHRHERLPVVPFVEPIAAARSSAAVNSAFVEQDVGKIDEGEDVEAWLMNNPSSSVLMADFVCSDADLLDFGFGSRNDVEKVAINRSFESFERNRAFPFGDSVVPSQSKTNLSFSDEDLMNRRFENNCFDIDFSQPEKHHHNITTSNDYEQLLITSSFNYSTQHSASSSETGVVPDSEVSYTFTNSSASGGSGEVGDGGSSAENGAPAREMDRKARVMRYREKRKSRKFQKTIRYASRKAYAETRPRIKGRFAKRTEMNETGEIDQLIYGFGSGSGSGGFFVDHVGYGVVPSF